MRPAGSGLWQDAPHAEVIVVSSYLSHATLATTRLLPTILPWTGGFVLVGGARLAQYNTGYRSATAIAGRKLRGQLEDLSQKDEDRVTVERVKP